MGNYKKQKLIRVSPKTFIHSNEFNYNIYKKDTGDFYKQYIHKGETYSDKDIESLENDNIEHLYIKHDDFEKYSKDINNYLSSVVSDTELSALVKSEIMHELACDTMHDLLSGEITKHKIDQVSQSVDITVEFILNDDTAVKSMLEVTSHDYYTYTHSVDVSTYSLAFGYYLGLNELQLKALGKGAMLHDLGKKRIPLEILNKNGKLTEDEFTIMKNHPTYGIDILKEMGEEDKIIFAIIEQHHEKICGGGYPKGLKGNEIHPFAQIVALCDIFNALTTKRSYKDAMTSFDAFKIMNQHMKTELNVKLLSKFIKFMAQ